MVGADLRPRLLMERDAEGAVGPSAVLPQDPFQLRVGLLSDEQIDGLRRRKKGKVVAEYQKKQNDVGFSSRLFWYTFLTRLARSIYTQTYGEPHGGI